MDQLFSLGHVSGARKILGLAPRNMNSGRSREKKKKRAESAVRQFESDPEEIFG
jgi:hypothetical protein